MSVFRAIYQDRETSLVYCYLTNPPIKVALPGLSALL
jgi:hypothetical protein